MSNGPYGASVAYSGGLWSILSGLTKSTDPPSDKVGLSLL